MFLGDFGFGTGYDPVPERSELLEKASQCFATGYLFLIFGAVLIFATPLLVGSLIVYIFISLARGLKNRFDLFRNGKVTDESYYIDCWVCFLFWIIAGAAIGRLAGPETAAGAALCSGMIGAILEGMYFVVEHMQLPPVAVSAPRQINWGGPYHDYGYNGGYKTRRASGSWHWTGYQCDEGPKEDTLYTTS